LDEFEDAVDLEFDGVETNLDVRNEIGVPFLIDFSDFSTTGGSAGSEDFGSAILPGAGVSGTTGTVPAAVSTTQESNITFTFGDNGGDEMDNIINNFPEQFVSPSSGTPNPGAVTPSTTHNFMSLNSEMEIIATIDVPLTISLGEYILDTISFDIDLGDIDSAEKVIIGVNSTNTLPFNAYAFIHADDVTNPKLNVSDTTIFTRGTNEQHKIEISDPDRIRDLIAADELKIIISVDTEGGSATPINSNMKLELDLYVNAKFFIDPN